MCPKQPPWKTLFSQVGRSPPTISRNIVKTTSYTKFPRGLRETHTGKVVHDPISKISARQCTPSKAGGGIHVPHEVLHGFALTWRRRPSPNFLVHKNPGVQNNEDPIPMGLVKCRANAPSPATMVTPFGGSGSDTAITRAIVTSQHTKYPLPLNQFGLVEILELGAMETIHAAAAAAVVVLTWGGRHPSEGDLDLGRGGADRAPVLCEAHLHRGAGLQPHRVHLFVHVHATDAVDFIQPSTQRLVLF